MEKFIIKKRKLSDYNGQSAVALAESESISNGKFKKRRKIAYTAIVI